MLGFLKKLFGLKTAETVSTAPYKIESPVVQAAPAVVENQITDAVTVKPVEQSAPAKKAKQAPKKPAAPKQPAKKQPAPKQNAPKQGGNRGRKPKAKTQ